jgi:hypothetical protein
MTHDELVQIAEFARTLPTHEYDQGVPWPSAAMAYAFRMVTGAWVRGASPEEAGEMCRRAIDEAVAHLAAGERVTVQ